MRQDHVRPTGVRVTAMPDPGGNTGGFSGPVGAQQVGISATQFRVTGLGDADPWWINPSSDEHDPLGGPGDKLAARLERIQSHQLAVHQRRNNHTRGCGGTGTEPKELLEASPVDSGPWSAQHVGLGTVTSGQQMEAGEHLARPLPPGRRQVDRLGGGSDCASGDRVTGGGGRAAR